VSTVAGNGERWFIGEGHLADIISLWEPLGICLDKDGNLFIADSCNEIVRKVDARTKTVSTVAGSGSQGFSGDNRLATSAELRTPSGVYVDSSGNIFIADSRNSRVRKVDSKTGIITTIAGSGQIGYSGDGGSAKAAALDLPYSIFVDSTGNVFIADIYNHRIRRVDAKTGIISTVAGNGLKEYSGDGKPAISAGLDGPFGLFVTPSGDLYIADTGNSRIRKVDAKTGIISTVAGNDERGFNGDGMHALQTSLNGPKGVFVDAFGNLFIADTGNHRLRKVDAKTGLVSTMAGNGKKGFGGNSGKATEMNLNTPWSVFGDASGNIYFCEKGFYLIRRLQGDIAVGIQPASQLLPAAWGKAKAELFQNFPNPANPETWLPYRLLEAADITISIYNSKGDVVRRLVLGQKPEGDYLTKSEAAYWDGRSETGEKVASGLYFYQIQAGRFVDTRRLVVIK
jgi:streptogramin lyase